jgi:hypothetical protein
MMRIKKLCLDIFTSHSTTQSQAMTKYYTIEFVSVSGKTSQGLKVLASSKSIRA